MSAEVVMVLGAPASGKSTLSNNLANKGYVHLNRDTEGGKVIDLLPKMESELRNQKSIVLDNLFATKASRQPFIDLARRMNIPVRCLWMGTSIEDSQINALHRMWQRHGKLFLTPDSLKGVKDPNMFPIAVFFKYKKEFEVPSTAEGFTSIRKEAFVRKYDPSYVAKAVIFDYDQTLRCVDPGSEYEYPLNPDDVRLLPGRKEAVAKAKRDGYILLGCSNQSGVSKGILSNASCMACFEKTNDLIGQDIDFVFCPHSVPPTCYCRKPQSGLGVLLIENYKLDPRQCIFVGDQTTDKTFATRLGMTYVDQSVYFS